MFVVRCEERVQVAPPTIEHPNPFIRPQGGAACLVVEEGRTRSQQNRERHPRDGGRLEPHRAAPATARRNNSRGHVSAFRCKPLGTWSSERHAPSRFARKAPYDVVRRPSIELASRPRRGAPVPEVQIATVPLAHVVPRLIRPGPFEVADPPGPHAPAPRP